MKLIKSSPTVIIDQTDPGDETLKRFRYQITYSCIASLAILKYENISEIYCEHFEDILVKLKSQKYIGIQVKTKELKWGPFECSDAAIVESIVKFIKLNSKFPDCFERFVIVTNNDFSKLKPAVDISIFIESCKKGHGNDLLKARSKSKKWIEEVAKKSNCKNEEVLNILRIVDLKPFSHINDIRKVLIDELRSISRLKSFTYGKLESLADILIMKHFNASSLQQEGYEPFHLLVTAQDNNMNAIIEAKKITESILNNIIDSAIDDPVTLFIKDNLQIDDIQKGYQKLEIKMDAGKISNENIVLFKDNKYSVENLFATWLYKDITEADKKYNQIRLIVQNECQAVYDEMIATNNIFFGMEMLTEIRKKLRERFFSDQSSFFDCKYEHLLGMAAVLTEECKIWWSIKFNINSI